MKLQTAIMLFALLGGTPGAMAGTFDTIGGGYESFTLDGYTYTRSRENIYIKGGFPSLGSNLGIGNYGLSYTIDTNQDARHEIIIRFTTSGGGYGTSNQPILNFYLSGGGKSVLVGNYYKNNGEAGAARMQLFNGDASQGSRQGGSLTYILNDGYSTKAGSAYQTPTGTYYTASGGSKISDGTHCYKIIVETYKDSSDDKIALRYEGPNGTNQTGDALLSSLGITSLTSIGYFLGNEGGTVTLDGGSAGTSGVYTYSRIVTPTVNPEPEIPTEPIIPPGDPSVPEPSAFGLLAGLGAIALAASRRRRSR